MGCTGICRLGKKVHCLRNQLQQTGPSPHPLANDKITESQNDLELNRQPEESTWSGERKGFYSRSTYATDSCLAIS